MGAVVVQRVPAPEIEAAVLEAVRRERGGEASEGLSGDAVLREQVSRVTVHADRLAIELVGQGG